MPTPTPTPAAPPTMRTGAEDIAHTDGEDADLTKVQYDPRTNVKDINTRDFTAVRDTDATAGARSNKAIVDSKGNILGYSTTSDTTENLEWKKTP